MKHFIRQYVKISCGLVAAVVVSQATSALAGFTGLINGRGAGWAGAQVTSSVGTSNSVVTPGTNTANPSAAIVKTTGYLVGTNLPTGASTATKSLVQTIVTNVTGHALQATTSAANGDRADSFNPLLNSVVWPTRPFAKTSVTIYPLIVDPNGCGSGQPSYTYSWHLNGSDAGTAERLRIYTAPSNSGLPSVTDYLNNSGYDNIYDIWGCGLECGGTPPPGWTLAGDFTALSYGCSESAAPINSGSEGSGYPSGTPYPCASGFSYNQSFTLPCGTDPSQIMIIVDGVATSTPPSGNSDCSTIAGLVNDVSISGSLAPKDAVDLLHKLSDQQDKFTQVVQALSQDNLPDGLGKRSDVLHSTEDFIHRLADLLKGGRISSGDFAMINQCANYFANFYLPPDISGDSFSLYAQVQSLTGQISGLGLAPGDTKNLLDKLAQAQKKLNEANSKLARDPASYGDCENSLRDAVNQLQQLQQALSQFQAQGKISGPGNQMNTNILNGNLQSIIDTIVTPF